MREVVKRSIDIGLSCLVLIPMAPFFLIIACLVKVDSQGPVFYRGQRVGRYGYPFFIFKFRTMVEDAEKKGGSSTADDDPRITRVGGFLRKFKLDELPQLLNVIKGDMSLVGHRPNVQIDVDKYSAEERQILSARPGITDFASIVYSNEGEMLTGYSDPDRAYDELVRPGKIALQLRYLREQSTVTDLKIIAWTAYIVLRKPFAALKTTSAVSECHIGDHDGVGGAMSSVCRTEDLARQIRVHSLKMTSSGGSAHVGSCLSIADILAVLYGEVISVDPREPRLESRDRFILSKGHAGAAVYAVLAELGFFPREKLLTHYQNGSELSGHVSHKRLAGVEVSTGSLGHGLSIGAGIAYGAKLDHRQYRVFVLLSDGECDEGATWESVLFAAHHRLDNLIAIIDYNKIQSIGRVEDTLALEPFADKWKSFGWSVQEVDGHSHSHLRRALSAIPFQADKPSCLIAHTIKGKGVSFMEGEVLWHYRTARGEEFEKALRELEA